MLHEFFALIAIGFGGHPTYDMMPGGGQHILRSIGNTEKTEEGNTSVIMLYVCDNHNCANLLMFPGNILESHKIIGIEIWIWYCVYLNLSFNQVTPVPESGLRPTPDSD